MDVGVHLKINMEWGAVKVENYNFSESSRHVSHLLFDRRSALEDHEKSDLDPDQDHLPKSDLRSRLDPDLT